MTVIGAGVGGLVSAICLANSGFEVRVIEKQPGPGGKLRQINIEDRQIDSGPTVFTMPWIFEEIFADCGFNFHDHVSLVPMDIIARHSWTDGSMLDLFSDKEKSIEAVREFAGPNEAKGFERFCRDAESVYDILDHTYIRSPKPSVMGLIKGAGLKRTGKFLGTKPYTSLWDSLRSYFSDPRLQQLFGRYATYCGSSPFLAPATLMLIAHVELKGVWIIEGGMYALADALQEVAQSLGVEFEYGTSVQSVDINNNQVSGVTLSDGSFCPSDAIVSNVDIKALINGYLGNTAAKMTGLKTPRQNSLSAITWSMVAQTRGFELSHHNVFFSSDYRSEFDQIFKNDQLPSDPTVYICAQDRCGANGSHGLNNLGESLLCIVNAPPNEDPSLWNQRSVEAAHAMLLSLLESHDLELSTKPELTQITTPTDFNNLFPSSRGAIYGEALHGWNTAFNRPTARTKVRGLYLAGGSIHPGPGLPMVATSGRLAASCLINDFIN